MIAPNSALPDQRLKETDWTEDYYKKCATSILMSHAGYWYSNYNRTNRISEIQENIRLYFGEQSGQDWQSQRQVLRGLTSNASDGGSTAIYTPGMQSFTFLNHHIGSMAKMVANFDKTLSTRSIYANRSSTKGVMRDLLTFKMDNESIYSTLKTAGGIFKDIPEHIQLNTKEKISEFVETNFKEKNEILAHYLSLEIMNRNWYQTEFTEQAKWALIGGTVGMKIENINSSIIPTWNTIGSKNLIQDMRTDSNHGKYNEFVGEATYMPIDEAIQYFKLDKEQAESLRNGANDSTINGLYGFNIYDIQNKVNMVSVVNTYWHSYTESKNLTDDRYGNYHIKLVNGKGELTNYNRTIRQATLIGVNIVTNYGIRPNIVANSFGYKPLLPIITCTTGTGMIDGRNKSMASNLQGLQRVYDQYVYKLQEAINTDYGKILFFDPSKMSAGNYMQQLLISLRTTKTIEINGENGDGRSGLPVEMQDMSLSPNTSFYLTLMESTYRQMQLLTSTSDAALGMQTSTMGKGVMEQTITQNSNGSYTWISDLIKHYRNIMQYSTDQARINIAASGEEEIDIPLDFGDYGVVKLTPEDAFEQIGIYINFDNIIDEQLKNNLIQSLAPYQQTGELPLWVIPQILGAGSLTEIQNISEKAHKEMLDIRNRQQAAAFEEKAMLADQKSADARYVADQQRGMTNDAADAKLTETAVKLQHEQAMKEGEGQ